MTSVQCYNMPVQVIVIEFNPTSKLTKNVLELFNNSLHILRLTYCDAVRGQQVFCLWVRLAWQCMMGPWWSLWNGWDVLSHARIPQKLLLLLAACYGLYGMQGIWRSSRRSLRSQIKLLMMENYMFVSDLWLLSGWISHQAEIYYAITVIYFFYEIKYV